MKRRNSITILFVIFMVLQVFAEEHPLVKLFEFENKREQGYLFRRPYSELAPQDDGTGSGIKFDTLGNAYMTQVETKSFYSFNLDTGKLEFLQSLDYIRDELGFNAITEKYYFFDGGTSGRAKLYDKNFNLIFSVNLLSWPLRLSVKGTYYDEQCDVLFFIDDNSNLYSIEHPSMDEAQNKANFKGPTETIEMLNSGKYAPHLTAKNNKSLCIDQSDKSYYWDGKRINGHRYQLFNENTIYYWPNSALEGMIEFNLYVPYGDVESIAIHPCGDMYMLGINWNTNTHILYRIENTWDPEWRASWYDAHPDAPGQELPSGNVAQAAAPKVRTGYLNGDRIRLRKGPGTGTDSLGTYSINTTFTILENSGVKQTIDGVTDEWIKVRLSDGTEGYFYGQYVSEK